MTRDDLIDALMDMEANFNVYYTNERCTDRYQHPIDFAEIKSVGGDEYIIALS